MLSIRTEIIQQLNGSIFVLLLILIFVGIALFKAGRWVELFKTHEKRMDGFDGLKEDVIVIKTKVDLIYQNTNPNSPIRAASPINLTDVGQEIISNLQAMEMLNKYADELKNEVDKVSPKNPYDIQMMAMEVARKNLLEKLDEHELTKVKEEAYKRGLLIEDVLSVFGVLLRNCILKERNIPISDIDKHAPKQ
jgi:predicted amino acid-binding ACT domain protein